MRNNDVGDDNGHTVVDDGTLQILARRHVPYDARHQLLDIGLGRAAQQTDQCGNTAGILDRPFVLVVLPTI